MMNDVPPEIQQAIARVIQLAEYYLEERILCTPMEEIHADEEAIKVAKWALLPVPTPVEEKEIYTEDDVPF